MNDTIDVYIERRNWVARHILRKPRYRISLAHCHGYETVAEGNTVEATWAAVVRFTQLMGGGQVTSECPFDDRGRLR